MAQVLEEVEEVAVAALGGEHRDAVEAYRRERVLTTSDNAGDRARGREAFRAHIEPLLTSDVAARLGELKELIRAKFNALAVDAIDIFSLRPGEQANGVAIDLRERLNSNSSGAARA